jgi:tyrosyl-DNA phosphodiesterase 2
MYKANKINTFPKYILKEMALSNDSLSKNFEKFPSYRFDKTKRSWIDVSNEPSTIINNKILTIMTYNIWFEPVNFSNRLKGIFEILKNYSPDFICLQEVTEPFMKEVINKDFIRENYCFSGNFKGDYDVLMLSKYNVSFYTKELKSNMGRKLLLTEINHSFDNEKFNNILIATSHFESLNNAYTRKIQLQTAFDILNQSDTALIMGDFNFDSSWKIEEANIDKNYGDCWFEFREKHNLKDEDRYTMPENKYFPAWRPDRILFKNDKIFELEFFEIIGKDVIEQDVPNNEVKTPSDHYGLFTMFNIKN